MGPSAKSTRSGWIMSLRLGVALLVSHGIDAAPSPSRTNGRAIRPRATTDSTSTQPSGLSVQVWAPLVAITVVIIVMIVYSCIKRRKYTTVTATARAAANNNSGSNNSGANASTTSLTADLLSGSAGGTAAEARRQRRTRRTPSQISTRSLPAYMEDPGDSEMVLVRGDRELEDPMPTVQEGDLSYNTSGSLGSLGFHITQTSQTNLLGPDRTLSPPAGDTRASFETIRSESENSHDGLLQSSSHHSRQLSAEEIEARGEAPPYFEVVGEADIAEGMEMRGIRTPIGSPVPVATPTPSEMREVAAPEPADGNEASTSPPSAFDNAGRQRSGFRNFATRFTNFMPYSSPAPMSTTSLESSSADRAMSPSSSRHGPTGSVSTLASTVSHILPRSRSNHSLQSSPSATNLTSPSATSLGPISAPLTHTLLRTEFEYPRGGPTSEQMKFISSRETMGKFGVPYGFAAQAQALASREALALSPDMAPPPFESPVAEAGPSAARPEGADEDPSSSSLDNAERTSVNTERPVDAERTPVDTERTPVDAGRAPIDRVDAERTPVNRVDSQDSIPLTTPPMLALPVAASSSDNISSGSSAGDSVVTFTTAAEEPFTEGGHKSGMYVDPDLDSRSPTPTPASGPLTISIDGVPSNPVPTPPPTPPRQSLSVLAPDVPNIVVAPASPAS